MSEDLSGVGRHELEARLLGRKDDSGKVRVDLFPPQALIAISLVLGFGANKYGEDNWRQVDRAKDRYYAATLRHLLAWREGRENDEESGLPHLAHAACSIVFLLVLDRRDERKAE